MANVCKTEKIAIIGAGRVGTTFAFAALIRNIVAEVMLVDIDQERCKGEVLDLAHGLSHVNSGKVYQGTLKQAATADIIVITAGVAQKPGQTRLQLVETNAKIIKGILKEMGKINPMAILIIVSNPVDVLTYVAQKCSNLPAGQIFGSGTDLDTARLQYLLGKHFNMHPRSVNAFIIGEHGDSELAVWSSANVAGIPIKKTRGYSPAKMRAYMTETRSAAGKIIKLKGATFFAISMALIEICTAILKDQNLVLPVSTYIENYCGIKDVCLAVPAVIGRSGIKKLIKLPLAAAEKKQLQKSARILKKTLKLINC